MGIVDWILTILYPPACPGCDTSVKRQGDWCTFCRNSTWHPRMISGSRHGYLDGCYAIGDYRGPLRNALIGLKFQGDMSKKHGLHTLIKEFPWWNLLSQSAMVMPIPISKKRKKERGFDQIEVIFADFFKEDGWEWNPGLIKQKDTKPQSGLSKMERRSNIKNSFCLKQGVLVQQRHIILVDDIYTTGSTMEEAARILHKGGALSITGVVIASGAL